MKQQSRTKFTTSRQEENSLQAHVEMCELRYQQLDQRIVRIEQQVDTLNLDLKNFRNDVAEKFAEIKSLIVESQNQRFQTMVASSATVIVALIGLLGYIVVNLK